MVSFAELASAKPPMWSAAADDWAALGTQLGNGETDLADETQQPVRSGWSGQASAAALKKIGSLIDALDAAQGEVSAVSDVLTGLAEAVAIAQRTLGEAADLATRYGVQIGPQGSLSLDAGPPYLPGAAPTNPLTVAPGPQVQAVKQLIDEALREATQADRAAAVALARLATRAGVADVAGAYGTDVNEASRAELQMIIDSIPAGPPQFVAAWWARLSQAERQKLMLAAPGTLGSLAGIPASVRAELRGGTGIDRVKLIQYALKNWNNTGDDIFGPKGDNCTNFVSDALAAAGLAQHGQFPFGRTDAQHDWYRTPADPFGLPGPFRSGQAHPQLLVD